MTNKAVLLRSVSALATAAASTAGGVQHASAQAVAPSANGYYYSVTGGIALSPSERYLSDIEDKVGVTEQGYSEGSSSYTEGTPPIAPWEEGFASWSSYSESDSSGLDDFAGLFASVSLGKQIDPNWDIRGSLSIVKGGEQTVSGYAYTYGGSNSSFNGESPFGSSYEGGGSGSGYAGLSAAGEISYGFTAADLEVGYTPVLSDSFNVRLFAGVRALSFKSEFEGEGYGSGSGRTTFEVDGPGSGSSFSSSSYYRYSEEFSGKSTLEFTGIGPRIGTQVATRFEGSNFGLSGSVAASVLFGQKKVTNSGYFSSYSSSYFEVSGSNGLSDSGSSFSSDDGYDSISSSSNATVLNVQAAVGVDYYFNDSTALTVGYQAEKLTEMNSNGPSIQEIDTLTHGAFVKLSGSF